MKRLLSIAVVSALVVSCTGGSKNVEPNAPTSQPLVTKTDRPLVDSVAAVAPKSYDTLKPPAINPRKNLKTNPLPKEDFGGKSFDERYAAKRDSIFKAARATMRKEMDSLAALRRTIQIEDSLKRLK